MMANEVRLIDANALQRLLLPIAMGLEKEYGSLGGAISGVMAHIDAAPTIDSKTLRPKGRWELMAEADYKCSVCGFRFTSGDPIEMFPYCRCGAKMEDDCK